MGLPENHKRGYLCKTNLNLDCDTTNNLTYATEFAVGNFEHREKFICSYVRLCRSIGARYNSTSMTQDDIISEALVAVCLVPGEIHAGKFDPNIPIDHYVKSRIKSRCINAIRHNHLLKVPWRAYCEKGIRFERKDVVYPGERFPNLPRLNIPYNVLEHCKERETSTKVEIKLPDTLSIAEIKLTKFIANGLTVTEISKKLGICYNSAKKRITKLCDKLQAELIVDA